MNLADLPEDQHIVLQAVERFARRAGAKAYLVGGAVRDALLERRIYDVDVAVEGDAIDLARQVAANLPIDLRTHEAFGTAALTSASGRRVDLARTRTEEYPAIAALPTVRPAALEADLLRRDFTVNSMAVPLDSPDLSAPVDPSGGRKDLESRLLKVHHARSFLDDPTRILRGVRFEARLGLAFDSETERLARQAVADGALDALSSDRLRAELRLVTLEDAPPLVLWTRLDELGVCSRLGLGAGGSVAATLERASAAYAAWIGTYGDGHPVSRREALLAAVVLGQSPERRSELAARLNLPVPRALEEIATLITGPDLAPHDLDAELAPLDDLELLLVGAVGGERAAARVHQHLASQRDLELLIDGKTLLAQGFEPGPEIGEALEATRDARLDGRISPAEELGFAVKVLRSLLAIVLLAASLAAQSRDLRSVEVVGYDCSSDIGRREMTLFGNGTVRLRTWEAEDEPVMKLRELNPEQMTGFVNRLREVDLSESEETRASPSGDWIQQCTLELDLYELAAGDGEDRGPTRFAFGRYDSVSLALSRIVNVVEEITAWAEEQAVAGEFPPRYDPQPGDILERQDGVLFEVIAFTSDQRGVELWGVEQPLVMYLAVEDVIGEFVRLVERP